jgi:hypothetical protein
MVLKRNVYRIVVQNERSLGLDGRIKMRHKEYNGRVWNGVKIKKIRCLM